MKLMVIYGGLYQILNEYSNTSTKTYILWPVDDKARADYEARTAGRSLKRDRK